MEIFFRRRKHFFLFCAVRGLCASYVRITKDYRRFCCDLNQVLYRSKELFQYLTELNVLREFNDEKNFYRIRMQMWRNMGTIRSLRHSPESLLVSRRKRIHNNKAINYLIHVLRSVSSHNNIPKWSAQQLVIVVRFGSRSARPQRGRASVLDIQILIKVLLSPQH